MIYDLLVSPDLVEYKKAEEQMERRVEQVISKKQKSLLWLLEHPPVYTAGSSASAEELIDHNFLPIHKTGRGGKYTYHGPGQRIGYFIFDLKELFANNPPDLKKYIFLLEEIIIQTLGEINIKAFRKNENIGVWVNYQNKDAKIAAVGVRVKKWVAFHGVAVNINPDLNHYKGIIPCGINDFGVTSIKELGIKIEKNEFDQTFVKYVNKVFENVS